MDIGFDIETLLSPVSSESPCGPDPDDNSSLFSKASHIRKAALGSPEQVMGGSVIPAVEPDWTEVCVLSREFLKECKDVRVAVLLTRGLLNRDGMGGLAAGLELVARLLQLHWPNLYPRLIDEDQEVQHEVRINAVAELAGSEFLRDLNDIPLVRSRAVGDFTYRDYRVANGSLKVSADTPSPNLAHITGAFMEADSQRLQADRAAIAASLASIQTINLCFSESLSGTSVPDLSKLAQELNAIAKIYDGFMGQRGLGGFPVNATGENVEQPPVANLVAMPKIIGEIRSREDVLSQIDKICQYYQRYEPSSPVPLILSRAKKLAAMDFMEIMRDMCPDSLSTVQQLAGVFDAGADQVKDRNTR